MRDVARIPNALRGAVLAFACAAVLAGCGGRSAPQGAGTGILNVTEKDFAISAPTHVRAGDLLIRSRNHGPDDHELIVVRLDGKQLPLRADGITVDEDMLVKAGVEAGALEPIGRTVGELHVHLTPGRYELFCNMAGHYLGGMHRVLRVET
jgi:uncharacterized cupredoxin-like copper-binding protein